MSFKPVGAGQSSGAMFGIELSFLTSCVNGDAKCWMSSAFVYQTSFPAIVFSRIRFNTVANQRGGNTSLLTMRDPKHCLNSSSELDSQTPGDSVVAYTLKRYLLDSFRCSALVISCRDNLPSNCCLHWYNVCACVRLPELSLVPPTPNKQSATLGSST